MCLLLLLMFTFIYENGSNPLDNRTAQFVVRTKDIKGVFLLFPANLILHCMFQVASGLNKSLTCIKYNLRNNRVVSVEEVELACCETTISD